MELNASDMGNCSSNSCSGGRCVDGVEDVPSYPDWMGQLPEKLHSVPLSNIAIPGSHDSTAAYLNENAPLGPDCDATLKDVCELFATARTIVYNWSKTQSLRYMQQLEAGIRYFDLRTSTMTGTEDLYLVHGMYSYTVKQMALAVNEFLNQHPKEIMLLDFNHFFGMTPDLHQSLLNLLMEIFGDKLCPYLDMDSVTLNTLWENKLQVLVFYHDKSAEDNFLFWPGSKIPSPWPNVTSCPPLLKILDNNYNKGRDMNSFYITQGILTPDKSTILSNIMGTLKAMLSTKCDVSFVQWLGGKRAGKNGINICIIDYVELSNYIPILMKLNQTLADEL